MCVFQRIPIIFFFVTTTLFSQEHVFSQEDIFEALEKAYPSIINIVPESENKYTDPAIKVRGRNFYWVNGRFLPEEDKEKWEAYNPNSFYHYPVEIPKTKNFAKEERIKIRQNTLPTRRRNKKTAHPAFYETLYGMTKLSDTNNEIVKTELFGKQVLIHQFAFEGLKQVEKEIYALAKYDSEVKNYIHTANIVYSFFWRRIAGTKARSLHSYGLAVDTLPKNNKKPIYWLWRQNQKIDWVSEDPSIRWNPPKKVVQIFEKYGFAWGGKWISYDTMHFEYRPEILLLNGFSVMRVEKISMPQMPLTEKLTFYQ